MIENLDALLEESPAKDQPVTIPAATPTPAPTPTTIPAEIASSCDFAPYPDSAPQFADVSPGQLVIQPSGISVFDLKIGEGATPGIDDTVEVHYAAGSPMAARSTPPTLEAKPSPSRSAESYRVSGTHFSG
jgi:hypothetical protein